MFVSFMVGVVLGTIGTLITLTLKQAHGVLRIDHSNPEKVRFLFEVGDLDSLSDKREIVLRIDHNADLSQR